MIEAGVEFAQTEDAVKAVMRIATDSSVNGESFLLSINEDSPSTDSYVVLKVDHLVF